jgi:hypothetical protein
MTEPELRSFIAEVEHELSLGSGTETYPAHGLLETALKFLKPQLPETSIPFIEILDAYHRQLPMLPKVLRMTATRRAQLTRRWAEDKDRQTPEWWAQYFARAARSDFLTGREKGNRSSWTADFDFFLQPKSMTKILEGAYGIAQARDSQTDYFAGLRHEQQARLSR